MRSGQTFKKLEAIDLKTGKENLEAPQCLPQHEADQTANDFLFVRTTTVFESSRWKFDRPSQYIMMDAGRTETATAEREFYARFFKFLAFVSAVIVLLMMGFLELGNSSVILGIIGLGALSLAACIVMKTKFNSQNNDINNLLTEAELAGMQDHDSDEEDGRNEAERMAQCPLEETPQLVRSCREELTFLRPKNGRYNVVYNAIYFGKSIRSESQLHLKFEENSKGNGWEISGLIISGSKQKESQTRRAISEGFLNTRGEMYWRLANSAESEETNVNLDGIYRGFFDIRSSALYDGDFKAGSAPPGRIVRMELIQEELEGDEIEDNWGASDIDGDWGTNSHNVEMVELDKSIV